MRGLRYWGRVFLAALSVQAAYAEDDELPFKRAQHVETRTDVAVCVVPSSGTRHPDGERISMNLNIDDDPALEIVTLRFDGSDLRKMFEPGSGHPSFHPGGRYLITDAYPHENVAFGDGTVPIRLIDTKTKACVNIARIYVSATKGKFRVDPHPAWDPSGRYVVFNGFANNTRQVYVADLTRLLR